MVEKRYQPIPIEEVDKHIVLDRKKDFRRLDLPQLLQEATTRPPQSRGTPEGALLDMDRATATTQARSVVNERKPELLTKRGVLHRWDLRETTG